MGHPRAHPGITLTSTTWDMAVGRGCSSYPGALPKKVLQPQELAVMLEQLQAGLSL